MIHDMTATVLDELARATGADPIVVRTGPWSGELWRGLRVVSVGIELALPTLDAYREHWKSVSVDGNRYSLGSAVGGVLQGLGLDPENPDRVYANRVQTVIKVDVADLRELLAGASDELRERYAHALDERNLTPSTPRT